MGFVSLREDIEEALTAAMIVTEKITSRSMPLDHAEKIVSALLKRCNYVKETMNEIKHLHSDLSIDTQNRIYSLRSEREDALAKICELETMLTEQKNGYEVRLNMAAKKRELYT